MLFQRALAAGGGRPDSMRKGLAAGESMGAAAHSRSKKKAANGESRVFFFQLTCGPRPKY